MLPFDIYFEKREANPLRKKEFEGIETNIDAFNREKESLSPEQAKILRKQIKLNVPPDKIEAWKKSKLKENESELKNKWLKTKISKDEYEKIYEKNGIKFFIPKNEKVLNTPRMFSLLRDLKFSVDSFLNEIKDILPLRKPRFIIKTLDTQHPYETNSISAPAYILDRIIYLDIDSINNPKYFIHEYAHFLADMIPRESYPLIQAEYRKMLDNYFRSAKKKKRHDLSMPSDVKLREKIAHKLGLPSDYSLINSDEFFAEIITHWKDLPNNINSYKFKQAIKRVLSRI